MAYILKSLKDAKIISHLSARILNIKKPRSGGDIKLFVKTVDTRGIPHEKRTLKGTERSIIQK